MGAVRSVLARARVRAAAGALRSVRALVRGRALTAARGFTPARALAIAALVGAVALGRCAPAGPRAIAYGQDACAYCLMTADDARFGAELVTARGKVYVFDSPVCLAGYLRAHSDLKGATAWVTDFTRPGTLVPAEQAHFRQTHRISSTMGVTIAALAPSDVAPAELTGPELTWKDVLNLSVEQERDAAR